MPAASLVIDRLLTPEQCRELAALTRPTTLPQPRRDGAARLRPRRIQVFRLSAAAAGRRAAPRALSAPRSDRQSLERAISASTCVTRPVMPAFLARCHAAGQTSRRRCCCATAPATTTACIRISTASTCFRCRSTILLSAPDHDFTGGEFVLDRAAPAHAIAAEVVPLRQGDAVVFAVHHRPVQRHRAASTASTCAMASAACARAQRIRSASSSTTRRDRAMSGDLFELEAAVESPGTILRREPCCCAASPAPNRRRSASRFSA